MSNFFTRLRIANVDALGPLFKYRLLNKNIKYLVTINGPLLAQKQTSSMKIIDQNGFTDPEGVKIEANEFSVPNAMNPISGKPIRAYWQIFDTTLPSRREYDKDLGMFIDKGQRIWFGNAKNFFTTISSSEYSKGWSEANIKPYITPGTSKPNTHDSTAVIQANITRKCSCKEKNVAVTTEYSSIPSGSSEGYLEPSYFSGVHLDASSKQEFAAYLRVNIKNAANYYGVPPLIIATIIEQENGEKAGKFQKIGQSAERAIQMTLSLMDQTDYNDWPKDVLNLNDKKTAQGVYGGSAGIFNMTKRTIDKATKHIEDNYCKPVLPSDVRYKEIPNLTGQTKVDMDTRYAGRDIQVDCYYCAAIVRQLIDDQVGKCFSGKLTKSQLQEVFKLYNGPKGDKYGVDSIAKLDAAAAKSKEMYYYEQ